MIRRRLFRVLIPLVILLATLTAGEPVHAGGRFNAPAGIAVDRYGNVYVADSGDGRIIRLSPNGVVLRAWVQRGTDFVGGAPTGIGVDRYGNVYVTDSENGAVVKYGPRGHLASQWGRSGDGEFNSPQGLAVGRQGSIFVANSDNDSVEKLTPRGRIENVWSLADQLGAAQAPQWVSVAADGTIYATAQEDCQSCVGGYSIEKLASNGAVLAAWSYDDTLAGIVVGGRGNIFAVDQDTNAIIKLAPDGQELARWSLPSVDGYAAPTGIAVDARGDIYVTDTYNDRIVKLSSTGRVLSTWD